MVDDIPLHRQQMYYIPTNKETELEESAIVQEFPEEERRARKISVHIDQNTQQYSGKLWNFSSFFQNFNHFFQNFISKVFKIYLFFQNFNPVPSNMKLNLTT